MARIRSIKPDFFTSLTIAALPLSARLTFIGLWCYVDDNGVGVDDARLIRAAVWPLEEDAGIVERIRDDLHELHRAGLIIRYTVAGKSYLAVRSWAEHQKISHAAKPRYPGPDRADPDADDPSGESPDKRRMNSGDSPEGSGDPPRPVFEGSEDRFSRASPETLRKDSGDAPEDREKSPNIPSDLDSCDTQESSGGAPEFLQSPPEILRPDREQGAGNREREAAPAEPRKRSRSRATAAPDRFPVTDQMRQWARERGVAADRLTRETERFLDHHRAKGSTFNDWAAAWRTWMSRSNDFAPPAQLAHPTRREDIF